MRVWVPSQGRLSSAGRIQAMRKPHRIITITAVGALAAGGTAIAAGGGDDDATDKPISGSALEKAKAAALADTPGQGHRDRGRRRGELLRGRGHAARRLPGRRPARPRLQRRQLEDGLRGRRVVLPQWRGMPTREQITEALKSVIDPELRKDIVELEMVRAIDIKDGGVVDVTVSLTTPGCPIKGHFQTVGREARDLRRGRHARERRLRRADRPGEAGPAAPARPARTACPRARSPRSPT